MPEDSRMPTVPRQPPAERVAYAPGRAPVRVTTRTPARGRAAVHRPARRRPARGAPLPVAALVATLLAAATSAVPVVGLSIAGSWGSASPAGTARLAAAAWLLAHGVPVRTPYDLITLAPLTVSAVAFWRVARAGVHTSRAIGAHRPGSSLARVAAAMLAVATAYAAIGYAVATLVTSEQVDLSPPRAAANLGVFGALAAGLGALQHSHAGRTAASRAPALLRDAARTGVAAAALVVAAGAAAAGIALAVHAGAAAKMFGTYQVGVVGQIGITLACLAYLPNLAVWGAAYLVGPGFSLGAGTIWSPGEVISGPIPGLPVLAALPEMPLTGVGPALLGVPLLAGVVAGALGARLRPRTWGTRLGAAALAGPVAGAVLTALAQASSGGLGSGRLAAMGPAGDWRLGLLAGLVIALGAMLGALAVPPSRRAKS